MGAKAKRKGTRREHASRRLLEAPRHAVLRMAGSPSTPDRITCSCPVVVESRKEAVKGREQTCSKILIGASRFFSQSPISPSPHALRPLRPAVTLHKQTTEPDMDTVDFRLQPLNTVEPLRQVYQADARPATQRASSEEDGDAPTAVRTKEPRTRASVPT